MNKNKIIQMIDKILLAIICVGLIISAFLIGSPLENNMECIITIINFMGLVYTILKIFLERKNMEKPIHTRVTSKEYSVKKRKKDIKTYLESKKKAEFSELFTTYNKSYIVVTFMSILELAKEEDIILTQEANFDKIFIELKVK